MAIPISTLIRFLLFTIDIWNILLIFLVLSLFNDNVLDQVFLNSIFYSYITIQVSLSKLPFNLFKFDFYALSIISHSLLELELILYFISLKSPPKD